MYEEYLKEVIDKIKDLGLYGKDLREIMLISVNACTEMIRDAGVTPTKFKRDIEALQTNQIHLIYKMDKLK